MTDIAVRSPNRWLAMLVISISVSIIIMDATVVNVVLPVLIRDLSLTAADAEWVNSIYSLVFAALLITAGRLGDMHGRRRMLLIGTVIFGIASVLASTAGNGTALIAARLLQGVGGAMILPATLSTVNAMFTGRERGIAFAIWGSTIGGMAALGPLAGGWLTTAFSWHWAFLINVPVVLIMLVGTLAIVPETREAGLRRGLDPLGIVLSMLGLGSFVFGLIEGQRYGWWAPTALAPAGLPLSPVPIAFAVGIVCLIAFVLHERARRAAGRAVLVDLDLFRLRSFGFGSIAALVVALGEFGMLFSLPLFVQGALGYSALDTGLLIVFLAIGTFLISGGTPQLGRRLGGRAVVRLGLATEIVAIIGLGLSFSTGAAFWVLAGWLFLYGVGVGLATAQLTSVILAEVPVEQSGEASGLQSTVRQLGSALGIALLGTLLVTTLSSNFSGALDAMTGLAAADKAAALALVRDSVGAAIPELGTLTGAGPAIVDAARGALLDAARLTTLIAAAVLLVGFAATFGLPALKTHDDA
ncbi:MAG: DHA2 family efflux MFS transporter permease subunit [Hyphomicrobiales bacterium]|nr:MAG: DHA2 family efflux MFS transporter permease subunit [Hyphomicrobiales bacterium]